MQKMKIRESRCNPLGYNKDSWNIRVINHVNAGTVKFSPPIER